MSKPKKLLAISPEQYRLLMDRIDEVCQMKTETPIQRKISMLDSKMEEILNDESMSDWDKMQAYSNAMREYMEFHKQEKTDVEVHPQLPQVMVTPSPEPNTTKKKKKRTYPKQVDTESAAYKQLTKDWIRL